MTCYFNIISNNKKNVKSIFNPVFLDTLILLPWSLLHFLSLNHFASYLQQPTNSWLWLFFHKLSLTFSFLLVHFPFSLILHKLICRSFGTWRIRSLSTQSGKKSCFDAHARGPSWQMEEKATIVLKGKSLPEAKVLTYIFLLRDIHSLIYKQIPTSKGCSHIMWTQGTGLVHKLRESDNDLSYLLTRDTLLTILIPKQFSKNYLLKWALYQRRIFKGTFWWKNKEKNSLNRWS